MTYKNVGCNQGQKKSGDIFVNGIVLNRDLHFPSIDTKNTLIDSTPYPVNAESGFVDTATTFENGKTGKILGV